ncbi:MAG: M6 family metalloprotease domain-containing protein [Bacteroidales bacterium]|nr:M6 family metalloprotease domain-containing protein [Bacteroidales bacterium]
MKYLKIFTLSALFVSLFMWTNVARAVTAYPYPFQYQQPDGSMVTIQLKGDEIVHWAETMDGFTLLNNGKDGWEYAILDSNADLICSGILAKEPQERSSEALALLLNTPQQLRFSKKQLQMLNAFWNAGKSVKDTDTFNPNGSKKLIMILIGYTDLAFTKSQTDFDGLMNQIGYNLNGAVGSVKDYFLELSYGNFNINTTVVGPYTAAHDMAYYGAPNGSGGHDIRAGELIDEAVNLANPDVNFADYDNDGDGSVDGVYVIYAGYGEASGASANTIWPHAGGINEYLDGVSISKYSCSNELSGTSGTAMTTIGVICHEFGHVCGSPDYYDTDYSVDGQYDGTGSWDLMAGGSWNGSPAGNRPPHMVPIEKVKNGWIVPIQLTIDASVSIQDITTHPVLYRFNTTTANEYFLIENRQKNGFNTSSPGHGLMIYHVDENYISTAGNKINTTSHQGMFPVSAVATNANGVHLSADYKINVSGCPWPGTSGKTTFSDATTPNALSWAGNSTNGALVNISETSGTVSFCYKSCPAVNPAFNLTALAPNGSTVELAWIKNAAGNEVILATSATNTFGDPANGIVYNVGDPIPGGGTIIYKGPASAFNQTGLTATSTYYYKLWSFNSTPDYSAGITANAQTLCASISAFPYTEGFESGAFAGCWTQANIIGANAWGINTAGINSHPAAAHSGTKLARCNVLISNAGYVTKLITPPMDISGVSNPSLSFWHTQEAWGSSQDILRVYYRTSGTAEWNELAVYNSSTTAWTRETIELPEPSANYFIAFEATVNAGYGVCIDDLSVSSPVADFTSNVNVGCSGSVTANFTDASVGAGGSWEWDIDNNGTTDYTVQNPTHVYNAPGLYTVRLSVHNGAAQTVKENLILVMGSEPTVSTGCTLNSNSNNGNGYGIGISRFALGSIDYITPGNDGYYNNYACSKWTVLELNKTYSATIRTGTANNEGARVYIDYNDNGTFETGESVVSFPSNKEGTRTLTFTTPSSGVTLSKGLRMRVLSKFGSIPSTACDVSTYGQAEDYTVYFVNDATWAGSISSDWNTPGNWSYNAVPGASINVVIPSAATNFPVLTADFICNNLKINAGASVTVDPGKSLKVNGVLTNNAGTSGLVVKSDASGTGSLILSTTGVNARFERYLNNTDWMVSDDGWHFLSAPIASQSISPNFATDPFDFYSWYEAGNLWVNFKNTTEAPTWNDVNGSGDFVVGKGYMVAYDNEGTRSFEGVLNVDDVLVQGLTVTGSSALNRSWHLLGNPFSSALNWNATSNWNLNNIGGVAKIWNEENQSYSDLTSTPASVIPATNGFMVQVVSGTGNLSLPKNERVISTQPFFKSTEQSIKLTCRNMDSGSGQESVVCFNPNSTEGFDLMYDGDFLKGYGPEFYSTTGDLKLSTNSLPELYEGLEIPFSFTPNGESSYSISADGLNSLPYEAYLLDKKNALEVNLSEAGKYEFSASNTDGPVQFMLHFRKAEASGTLSIKWIDELLKIWYPNDQDIMKVSISDLSGRVVYETESNLTANPVSLDVNLSTGIYLVMVETNSGTVTEKLLIQ